MRNLPPAAGVGQPMRVMVLLLVGVLLVVPGCAEEDGDRVTDVAGIPVLDGAIQGPGTALGGGFEVTEGSVLLGTVFPGQAIKHRGELLEGGFRALLFVTGDVREVLQDYERQSAAVGLPLSKAAGGGRCSGGTDGIFMCSERAQRGQPEAGRSVFVQLWRGVGGGAVAPVASHLYMAYAEYGDEPSDAPLADLGSRRGEVREGPSLPDRWPHLADVGQPYEEVLGDGSLIVEAGTALVAPAGPDGTCGAGVSIAVFRIDGDPVESIRAYVEQTGRGDRGPLRAQRDGDGGRTWSLSWTNGESFEAVAQRPGEPAYLLLDHCGSD